MEFVLHNHSSYPRIGEKPTQQRLRRAYAARERGELSDAELAAVEREQIDALIHEQEQAGIDIVTDGQVRWHDPISHFMGGFEGVQIDGLLRYFDTNFYFRQPVITAQLQRREPILTHDFTMASRAARRIVKAVVTGPYTLARHCILASGYRDVATLAQALSEALVREVEELVRAGAQIIQVDEPAILAHPEDIRLLRQLLEPMWAVRGSAQLAVATYFADAEPLYAQLNSLPADILVLDLTYSTGLADTIASTGASKTLGLGVVDGRSTRLEDCAVVARRLTDMLRRYALEHVHLLPSCGLEHLPRDAALAKLSLLSEIRQALGATA